MYIKLFYLYRIMGQFGVVGGLGQLQGAMMAVAIWILAICALFQAFRKRQEGGLAHEQK